MRAYPRPVRLNLARPLRLLPPGLPGKARLARLLLGRSLEARDVIVRNAHGHSMLIPQLGSPIGIELLIHGIYEPRELNLVLSRLTEGSIFVDVGANIGAYTLPCSRKVGAGGLVVSIEASPRMYEYLKYNVDKNALSNVRVLNMAIGNRVGASAFWEAPPSSFGMGSLAPQFHNDPVQVSASTLDAVLESLQVGHVNVLKIDVEGFEEAVFLGGEKLLRGRTPPTILFEFLDWAEARAGFRPGGAQAILRRWGYSLWTLADFLRRLPPLDSPLTNGGAMLVAVRADPVRGDVQVGGA